MQNLARRRLRRTGVIVAIGTATAMAFGMVAGLVAKATERAFDVPMYAWLVENYRPNSSWAGFTAAFTQIGDPLPMLAQVAAATLILGLAFGRRWWVPAVALPLGLALEWGVQKSLEWILDRASPPLGTGAFPSGGSARFVLIYGLVFVLLCVRWPTIGRSWRIAGAVLIGLASLFEGYTRLYLLKHWVSDIPAGLVIGGILLASMYLVVRTLASDGRQADGLPLRAPMARGR